MTDLRRHIANCLAALERFGHVSEFARMRALGNWKDLARLCYSLKSFLIQSKTAARQRMPMKDLAVFS